MKKWIALLAIFLIPHAYAVHGDDYIYDTFTNGGSNTALESWTPTPTGTSWTEQFSDGGSLAVSAANDRVFGDAGGLSNGAYYTAAGTYASADYSVCVTVQGTVETGDDPYWIFGRWQDGNNFYVVEFNEDAAQIYVNNAGTFSTIGSAATDDSYDLLSGQSACLLFDGTTIEFTVNYNLILSTTDSTHSSAGVAGIGIGDIGETGTTGSDTDAQEMDDFLVEELDVTCTSALAPVAVNDLTGTGTLTWSNPSNAASSDNSYATATHSTNSTEFTTHYLYADEFPVSITGDIAGVQVTIERKCNVSGANEYCRASSVRLVKAGTVVTASNRASPTTNWTKSDVVKTYGSKIDLWGTTLTESDVEDTGFGVALSSNIRKFISTNPVASVDHITVSVCYYAAAAPADRRILIIQ